MGATSTSIGRWGEGEAVAHLKRCGFRILARNWTSNDREVPGEIDVVAARAGLLVFCEVKTRRSAAWGSALEAVDANKTARLRRLARLWLSGAAAAAARAADPPSSQRPARFDEVRFDVITVSTGPHPTLDHVEGAF